MRFCVFCFQLLSWQNPAFSRYRGYYKDFFAPVPRFSHFQGYWIKFFLPVPRASSISPKISLNFIFSGYHRKFFVSVPRKLYSILLPVKRNHIHMHNPKSIFFIILSQTYIFKQIYAKQNFFGLFKSNLPEMLQLC